MDDSSNFSFEMSSECFAAVNIPVSVFSMVLNSVFVFWMVFLQKGTERPKHLLTVLLGLLVGCNIIVHVCILLMAINNFSYTFDAFLVWCFVSLIAVYTMMTSVNSSHWLNVFYCFYIVPIQHAYFIWLKRNIAVFIYSALIVSAMVCLLGMSVNIAVIIISKNLNETSHTDWNGLIKSAKASLSMTLSLFFFSLCVMLVSSCVTGVFLWRHMNNMQNSRGSFASTRRQRSIKMTIINVTVQAVLHITCSALVAIDLLIICVSPWYFDMEMNLLCTIISLYSFGTTINLCVNQSLFRQRAVHVWQKIFKPHISSSVPTVAHTISSDILSN